MGVGKDCRIGHGHDIRGQILNAVRADNCILDTHGKGEHANQRNSAPTIGPRGCCECQHACTNKREPLYNVPNALVSPALPGRINDVPAKECAEGERDNGGDVNNIFIFYLVAAELEQYVDDAIKRMKAEGDFSALTDLSKIVAPISALTKLGTFLLRLKGVA